jgi:hypothetical protein
MQEKIQTIDDAIYQLIAIKKLHGNIEMATPIYSNGTVRHYTFYATIDPRSPDNKIVNIT